VLVLGDGHPHDLHVRLRVAVGGSGLDVDAADVFRDFEEHGVAVAVAVKAVVGVAVVVTAC
jgi:hypothetical protein